jgi:hypothetical protein
MAAEIILYDATKSPVKDAIDALRLIREGRERLRRARDVMIRYRDGDGSQAAHYDLLRVAGAYSQGDHATADAAAKASFDELDACIAKLTTNASVSDVLAAVDQACAKHGI